MPISYVSVLNKMAIVKFVSSTLKNKDNVLNGLKYHEINTYFGTNAILALFHTHRHNFEIQNALVPPMPDEDNNFGGSLVLDSRIS